MRERLQQLEWIDLGSAYYTSDEYRDCLSKLARIGRVLGGDKATLWAFDQLSYSPKSILDVGCGGGTFTIRLGKKYPQAKVVGIDTSAEAIAFAQDQARHQPSPVSNVSFYVPETPELTYSPKSFDVITSTLVCHHLSDSQLIDFLSKSYQTAKQAIILNDLHRHPLAWTSFAATAPLLFPNRLIIHDGLISIRRAFKKQDWIRYLQAAHIPLSRCSITWHWAFRWIVKIDCITP